MTPDQAGDRLGHLFERWVSSDLKVQILVFYRRNPGVIETPEGLALRLGVNPDALRAPLRDHVELGFLKERPVGNKVVLVYDPRRHRDLERVVEEEISKRMNGGGSAS